MVLRRPHRSIARNHRICEALFLARYIEKFGTGTLMMIRETATHGLPEPQFAQSPGEFVTTIWRDWLTEKLLADPVPSAKILARTPMGKVGVPEDLAGAMLYLASPASRLVTGHTLAVDGGWLAW